MKRRLITVVLFAVLAATVSSTVLYKIISANTQRTVSAAAVPVVVATQGLSAGAVITAADVRELEWPAAGSSQWLGRRQDVVGRVLLTSMGKDEPFAERRLAAKGAGAGLASTIPPGMRAVAVHVDELTGLSRFIFPGMHVDIISTGAAGGQNAQGAVTRTILQNVEVLSTGQSIEADAKAKPAAVPVFNLLVTPQQAEVLSQAVAQTRIQLVLRNPLDKGSFLPVATTPLRAAATDGARPKLPRAVAKAPEKAAAPVAAPPPAAPTVEVIHGTTKTTTAVGAVTEPELKQ